MSSEEKIYVLDEAAIVKKIAEFEKRGDYAVARGLLIAASMAGMDIASFRFYNATNETNSGSKNNPRKK